MDKVYINISNMNECYTKRYLQDEFRKDLVSIDELIELIQDLKGEYDSLQEQYDDLKQDMEDNYVHRPMSDYTGDARDDWY